MPSPPSPTRYSEVAKAFHWIIAALVVTQFVLFNLEDGLPKGSRKLHLLDWHKSVGMTILMLAILRLLWRLKHPPPALPADMPPLQRRLARGPPMAFYAFFFGMPP